MNKKGQGGLLIGIFLTGFLAGIFTGIYFKTGENADPNSLMVNVLGIFCDSVKNVENGDIAYKTCKRTFIILTIFLFIVGIVEIFATASQAGNVWIGLIIYGVGWFFGVIIV